LLVRMEKEGLVMIQPLVLESGSRWSGSASSPGQLELRLEG
jgi:hypothetical protein